MTESKHSEQIRVYANLPLIESRSIEKEQVADETPESDRRQIVRICAYIQNMKARESLNQIMASIISNNNFDTTDFVDKINASKKSESTFKPAEYWSDRNKGIDRNCKDFINRVYADALDGFFTTAHLKKIDKPLYDALYRIRPERDKEGNFRRWSLYDLNLPTKRDLYNRLEKESLDPEILTPEEEALKNFPNTASQRKSRSKKE